MKDARTGEAAAREASTTLPWNLIPEGGYILRPGTAAAVRTGAWRTGQKPVIDLGSCIHCLRCWIWCPDSAVVLDGDRVVGFDYDHCKGCGICEQVCPPKVHAISMAPEEA